MADRADVEEPQSVGADRALNVIAGHAKHQGTSSSSISARHDLRRVDFIGAYKGGSSPPASISASTRWLRRGQAAAHRHRAPEDESVVGRTTETQMLIGVYWGYVAMIEGLVARMKAEIGRP
jgi:type III pantothenate kinase